MSEALIEAIYAHDLDRLARLLAAGESPNQPFTSRYTSTPLDGAVSFLRFIPNGKPSGSIDAVVLLLRYGADANAWDADHSMTPLLTAVEMPHLEAVRLLLSAGADPNVKNDEGESPLHHCAINGLLEMARLLLRCGATKTMDKGGGSAGMNALSFAATRLNVDMVKLLLEYGANPNAPDLDRLTTLEHLDYLRSRVPEDPAAQERYSEIRRLVGGT